MAMTTKQKDFYTVIRIDRDVREAIVSEGKGMLDTFNSVLRRKFNLAPKTNITEGHHHNERENTDPTED